MKRKVEVPKHIQEAFQAKLTECVNIARQKTGKDVPMFTLVFAQMGQRAGSCSTSLFEGSIIKINADHLQNPKGYDEQLNDTLPHEIAHAVIDFLYPLINPTDGLSMLIKAITRRRREVGPHGPEWIQVMNWFGIHNPVTKHRMDMEGVTVRKKIDRPFKYICGCGAPHQLSLMLHLKVQKENKQRICRNCRQVIVYEKQWGKPPLKRMVKTPPVTIQAPKEPVPQTHRTVTRFIDGVLQNVRIPLTIL